VVSNYLSARIPLLVASVQWINQHGMPAQPSIEYFEPQGPTLIQTEEKREGIRIVELQPI
jgi:hypothetical protein